MNRILIADNNIVLVIILYIMPLLANIFMIAKSGYLTGDHWHKLAPTLPIILTCSIFLAAFYAIYFICCNSLAKNYYLSKISLTMWPKQLTTKSAFYLLLLQLLLIYFFGLVPVGSPSPGLISSVLSTFNPVYGLLVILTLNRARLTCIMGFAVSFMASITSASLFPVFYFACLMLYTQTKSISFRLKITSIVKYLLVILFLWLSFDLLLDGLAQLLVLRNSIRAGDFLFTNGTDNLSIDQIIRIALGRFSPLSAMIFLYDHVSGTSLSFLQNVDIFYFPKRVLDMLHLNIADSSSVSITTAYNDLIIGQQRNWGTIMSPTGALYALSHAGLENLILELLYLSTLMIILASISCPMISLQKSFLVLSSYQYLLSGDLFEFLNTIKSLILWIVLINFLGVFQRCSSVRAT